MPMVCMYGTLIDIAIVRRHVVGAIHICVGSARCSSDKDGYMPEPQKVGRAMVRFPRFFFIHKHSEDGTAEERAKI